mmetsp:Transcript_55990/g.133414  ORF Transcript_55990/g.133414 Transcript_55990/m.133414 type:complete len:514 (+) Transcript_55990:45-1586(+)
MLCEMRTPEDHPSSGSSATCRAAVLESLPSPVDAQCHNSIPYITILFEDGPAHGMLVHVSEDDTCDPKYWQFSDVHQRLPAAKVICTEDVTMFLADWPQEKEGFVTDEDGDVHHYIRQEQPPMVTVPHLAAGAAAKTDVPSSRGYGFAVLERLDENDLHLLGGDPKAKAKATAKRGRVAARLPGEGPTAAVTARKRQRTRTTPAEAVVPKVRTSTATLLPDSKLQEGSAGGRAADSLACSVPSQELPPPDCREEEDKGRCSQSVENTPRSAAGPALPPPEAEEEEEDAAASSSSECEVLGLQQLPSQAAPTLPQQDEEAPKDDDEGETGGRAALVNIELAKTARSICRTCGDKIEKDHLRCGFDAYLGGRTVTIWAHNKCFLDSMSCEYSRSRRGKCRGSGAAFSVGDLRVGFAIGDYRYWWLPRPAARWTKRIVAESGLKLDTLQGLDELETAHKQPLLELLRRGVLPTEELKATGPLPRGTKAASGGSGRKCSRKAPSKGEATAPSPSGGE